MDIQDIFKFFLHLDLYLKMMIDRFGPLTYVILFLIIFMETGFVVTPFLPGDSIIFAAGTFASLGFFNILTLYALLLTAAVLGDTLNYWIGHKIGPKIFEKENRFIKKEHLEKTKAFYEKHGGKTIILARFIPIVRTFAPFVAGVGIMNYGKFLTYNLVGAILWITLFLFAGYFFGNIEIVKENFEIVIVGIVILSVIPMAIEFIKSKRGSIKI